MDETRDVELGRQLETVAEPDHGTDYWRDVRLQVAEASADARRPGSGARLRAAFARRPVRLALAAFAVAALAAAALLAGLPGAPGPQSVSADQVLRRALAAYSSGHTWQAEVVVKAYGGMWDFDQTWDSNRRYHVYRYHIMRDMDGSFRLASRWKAPGPARTAVAEAAATTTADVVDLRYGIFVASHPGQVVTYDASSGVLRRSAPRHAELVATGCPLGPPDLWLSPPTGIDLGAMLRALEAASKLTLEDTVTDGRPTWTVSCSRGALVLPPSLARRADWPIYTLIVDQQTWLPVRFRQEMSGTLVTDIQFHDVRIDQPLPARAFAPRARSGQTIRRYDLGFRRVALDDIRALPGITPLVPGFVPGGYELSGVAVAARALTANHWVRARHIFALRYTSGFDALTISTRRPTDRYYSAKVDPVDAYDPVWAAMAQTEARITSGAFAGATARVIVAATSSVPHLWAVKDGVLLTIAGGATAKELLAVADSLQVYPGTSSPLAEPSGD